LEALGDALDLKDAETEGHSRRVTAFTMAIARKSHGRCPKNKSVIARGAFLHDIGKIAIPDRILRKPGKLTMKSEKRSCVSTAITATRCSRKIPFLAEACEIVYSHQEHFNGSGISSRT
jgi:HD-GYP domain-containing protein (c-di-GMP phosphodiesterase class II)